MPLTDERKSFPSLVTIRASIESEQLNGLKAKSNGLLFSRFSRLIEKIGSCSRNVRVGWRAEREKTWMEASVLTPNVLLLSAIQHDSSCRSGVCSLRVAFAGTSIVYGETNEHNARSR